VGFVVGGGICGVWLGGGVGCGGFGVFGGVVVVFLLVWGWCGFCLGGWGGWGVMKKKNLR